MIRKLMMVLAAMACMAAPAKEGLLEIDFGYARLRGRTHSDGLVILRDAKKPVICRIRRMGEQDSQSGKAFCPRRNIQGTDMRFFMRFLRRLGTSELLSI